MKKILCLILCSICLFSITGCKDRRKDDANSSSNAIIKDETQVFTKSSDYDNWKDFKNFATYVDGEQKSDKFSFKTPYDISQTINDLRAQMFAKDDNCFILNDAGLLWSILSVCGFSHVIDNLPTTVGLGTQLDPVCVTVVSI